MKKHMKQILTTVPLAFALVASAPALGGSAFTIDNVFGDHMVLQRNKPIRVTGSADPARKVTVRLGDDLVQTVEALFTPSLHAQYVTQVFEPPQYLEHRHDLLAGVLGVKATQASWIGLRTKCPMSA